MDCFYPIAVIRPNIKNRGEKYGAEKHCNLFVVRILWHVAKKLQIGFKPYGRNFEPPVIHPPKLWGKGERGVFVILPIRTRGQFPCLGHVGLPLVERHSDDDCIVGNP